MSPTLARVRVNPLTCGVALAATKAAWVAAWTRGRRGATYDVGSLLLEEGEGDSSTTVLAVRSRC